MSDDKPNEVEVFMTTMPEPAWGDGWYCRNHSPGEAFANANDRPKCWGCGAPKPQKAPSN
jgi:hypothetical protein